MALDPTECEHELRRAVNTGELVDLRSGDVEFDDPVRGAEWGHDRTVRAEILYDLLVATTSRAVVLRGARISGGLNLERRALLARSSSKGASATARSTYGKRVHPSFA